MGGDPNQVSPFCIIEFADGLDLIPISALAGISDPGGTTALLPTKTRGPVFTCFRYIQPLRISSSPRTTSSAIKHFSPISTRSYRPERFVEISASLPILAPISRYQLRI